MLRPQEQQRYLDTTTDEVRAPRAPGGRGADAVRVSLCPHPGQQADELPLRVLSGQLRKKMRRMQMFGGEYKIFA